MDRRNIFRLLMDQDLGVATDSEEGNVLIASTLELSESDADNEDGEEEEEQEEGKPMRQDEEYSLTELEPAEDVGDREMMFEGKKLKYKICNGILTISAPAMTQSKQIKAETEAQTSQDVVLQFGSEKKKISVNKDLLKAKIPYFNGMFSNCFQESSQPVINLGAAVDLKSASMLIHFISRGSLKVCGEDVQGIFVLSDLWGLEGIKDLCASFMISEMDNSNCLELLQLGEMHSCDTLTVKCKSLISQEFQIVCQSQAFLEVPADVLVCVLRLDGLNTGPQGEDTVFKAVMRWYHHDKDSREISLTNVLKRVNVCAVSKDVLSEMFRDLPQACVNEIQSRLDSGTVSERGHYKQRFMVCCGCSQSRTGPTCPRTNSVEIFDPEKGEFQRVAFSKAPSYGVALNLFGSIVFFATYLYSAETSNKKTYTSKVYTYRPCAEGNEWQLNPELFSREATECISDCLMKEGSVAHCPQKNLIYTIETNRCVCIQVCCKGGTIFCDYKNDLPSLMPFLDPSHTGLQGVCHHGSLFVLGGFYGPQMEHIFSNVVLLLCEDESKWERKNPMLIPRTGFAVTSYGDKLIVSGGYGGHNHRRRHQTCESYSVADDKWKYFASMQQSRSGHCIIVANHSLYAIGGKSYASQKLTSEGGWHPGGARIVSDFVELYDKSSKEWLRLARMHNARCNFYTVVM